MGEREQETLLSAGPEGLGLAGMTIKRRLIVRRLFVFLSLQLPLEPAGLAA